MTLVAYSRAVFYTVYVKLANINRPDTNMRRNTERIFLKILAFQLMLGGFLSMAVPAYAADTPIKPEGLPRTEGGSGMFSHILSIVFGIIGAFAVLNIVLSGFKYITSAGEPQKTSEAKNGIIYSIVGLMIAITAEAIVAFVVSKATK